MTLELMPHQNVTVDFGVKNKYIVNALDMGLGKSLTAIESAHRVKARCLIICPAYLKLKWKREVHKFHPGKVVSVLDSPKDFYSLWDTDYCIISYSFIAQAEILFEWADMVVWDEAHFLKEMDTARTLAAHKLVYENNPEYMFLLTGTPIQNRVYEFYSLLCMVHYCPARENNGFLDEFPTYVDFAERYSHLHEYKITVTTKIGKLAKVPVKQWTGLKNKEELKGWLRGCYIRYNSEDVLDLPEAQDIFVPVEYKDIPERGV
jgi:SNF2 family DNA or RNA helicase